MSILESRPAPHPLHARMKAAGVKLIVASFATGKSVGWISQTLLGYSKMPGELEQQLTELVEQAEREAAEAEKVEA